MNQSANMRLYVVIVERPRGPPGSFPRIHGPTLHDVTNGSIFASARCWRITDPDHFLLALGGRIRIAMQVRVARF